MTSQIAAYVCLSRVKRLPSICVMQPFSTFLFANGNPAGPERLVRKLSKQITADQAIHEWSALDDEAAEAEKTDPMAKKHLCACCYLKGKAEYMLDARDFGVKVAGDFYDKYISQGSWTKCLDCLRETGTDTTSKTTQTNQPEVFACKRCVERDWRQKLLPNGHGCSTCRNIFDASCWDAQLIRNHRHSDRDLVCPGCTERGYAPGKYEEHECTECREKFGSHNFEKSVLYDLKRGRTKHVTC